TTSDRPASDARRSPSICPPSWRSRYRIWAMYARRACRTASADTSCARGGNAMPEKQTLERARKDAREGKSASTQAGEFVREEMHHVREGKHGARSPKQAIAIGLSKARRAGVRLRAPKAGT